MSAQTENDPSSIDKFLDTFVLTDDDCQADEQQVNEEEIFGKISAVGNVAMDELTEEEIAILIGNMDKEEVEFVEYKPPTRAVRHAALQNDDIDDTDYCADDLEEDPETANTIDADRQIVATLMSLEESAQKIDQATSITGETVDDLSIELHDVKHLVIKVEEDISSMRAQNVATLEELKELRNSVMYMSQDMKHMARTIRAMYDHSIATSYAGRLDRSQRFRESFEDDEVHAGHDRELEWWKQTAATRETTTVTRAATTATVSELPATKTGEEA